jgi:Zn finger protein HypA/HybF involved in hydrogenase expression
VKGLDKSKVIFVEAHIEVMCAICNHTFDEFPGTDALVFNCPKCNRYYMLKTQVMPLNKEDIARYEKNKSKYGVNSRQSFNEI